MPLESVTLKGLVLTSFILAGAYATVTTAEPLSCPEEDGRQEVAMLPQF